MQQALATSSAVAAILGGATQQPAQGFTPSKPLPSANASGSNFEKVLTEAQNTGDDRQNTPVVTSVPTDTRTDIPTGPVADAPAKAAPAPKATEAPATDEAKAENLDQLIAEFIAGDMPLKPVIIAPDSVLVDAPVLADAPQLAEDATDAADAVTDGAPNGALETLPAPTPLTDQDARQPLSVGTPAPVALQAPVLSASQGLAPTATPAATPTIIPAAVTPAVTPAITPTAGPTVAQAPAPVLPSLPTNAGTPQASASPSHPSNAAQSAVAPSPILPEIASAETVSVTPSSAAPVTTDSAVLTAQPAVLPAAAEALDAETARPLAPQATVTTSSTPAIPELPDGESAQTLVEPHEHARPANSTTMTQAPNTAGAAAPPIQEGQVNQPSAPEVTPPATSVDSQQKAAQAETPIAVTAQTPSANTLTAAAQTVTAGPDATTDARAEARADARAQKAKAATGAATGLRANADQAPGQASPEATETPVQSARSLPAAPTAQTPVATKAIDGEADASVDAPVDLSGNTRAATTPTLTAQAATADTPAPTAAATNRKPAPSISLEAPVELAEQEAQSPLKRARDAAEPVETAAKNPANVAAAKKFASAMSQQAPAAQVAFAIARNAGDVPDRISINLFPEELGGVEILMEVHDNRRTEIVIRAERPETVEMMQRDARELQRALQMAGLDVNANDMSFEQGEKKNAEAFAGEFGGEDSQNDGEPDSEQTADAFAPVPLQWRSMTPGGIDMVA